MSKASHTASQKLCRIKGVREFGSKDESSGELRLKQSHIEIRLNQSDINCKKDKNSKLASQQVSKLASQQVSKSAS
jgi:hypothetical protein